MTSQTRVTLAEIAQEAGVSLATMSKVLNGRSDVAPQTRVRLEEHLARHGYRRRKVSVRSDIIELVFHELDPSWSMELIRGAEAVAHSEQMSITLTVSGDRHTPGDEWIDGVLRRRPAGVILIFSDLELRHQDKLRSRDIPLVVIDPAGDPSPGVASVGSTNWSGGVLATRHLIELGHRRIAVITGPEDMMCSLARLDGYRSAMNTAGVPIDNELIHFGDFHPDGGQRCAREILARPDRPTAIFAGSDLQALGVIAAASAMGLRVPEDVSVVGYDDIALARWTSPHLTTVHQPLQKMGEEAARLVLRLAEEEPVETTRLDLATHLVIRESTMPPPALFPTDSQK